MINQFSRTELLIGKEGIEKLKKSKVAVFGLGGVGSYVVEGLVRAGIGNFILVDNDDVDITNINRQIIATTKTIGMPKVEVAKNRILEINPDANVEIFKIFFMPETEGIIDNTIDYIADCVDSVKAKIELAERANILNIPIISCMGTGNKLDPTKFEITDIYKTSICPLAKVIRKELRKRNIQSLKVLYSKEEPIQIKNELEESNNFDEKNTENKDNAEKRKKNIPSSISFVPSVAGLTICSEIIKDILKRN